jgi:hypothetical protein
MLMRLKLDNSTRIVTREVQPHEIMVLEDRRKPFPKCQANQAYGHYVECSAPAKVKAYIRGQEAYLCGMHANCATNQHHFNG